MFSGSWAISENQLEPKTKPPLASLPNLNHCPNLLTKIMKYIYYCPTAYVI
jgi:hypothetical protein